MSFQSYFHKLPIVFFETRKEYKKEGKTIALRNQGQKDSSILILMFLVIFELAEQSEIVVLLVDDPFQCGRATSKFSKWRPRGAKSPLPKTKRRMQTTLLSFSLRR